MKVITHCHHFNNYYFLKFLLTHFLSCNLKMDPNDKMDSIVNILSYTHDKGKSLNKCLPNASM